MLIGLHGEAQSGKDTSYRMIADHAGSIPCRREGFADRLKLSAAAALGFIGDTDEAIEFCNQLKQPGIMIEVFDQNEGGTITDLTGREYLQYYGTEAHRDVFGQRFWVDMVLESSKRSELLVVTDVRFENEARAIRDRGGEIWHVIRPKGDKIAESAHSSERPLPPELIDRMILNDSDLLNLRVRVIDALRMFLRSCES